MLSQTLPPYNYHKSEYHLKSRQADLLHSKKFTGDIVWGPLDELGDDIDLIGEINSLPKLNDVDDFPLSQLIEKLHQSLIVTMTPVQKRHRYVTFTLGRLVILLITGVGAVGIVYWRYPGILINCFKKLKKKRSLVFIPPASAQTSSGETIAPVIFSEVWSVSAPGGHFPKWPPKNIHFSISQPLGHLET